MANYRIAVVDRQKAAKISRSSVRQAVEATLMAEGVEEAAIGVALMDDAAIQQLNQEYLQHNHPTDVLAFPYGQNGKCLEGDIAISVERAVEEAKARGVPVEAEVAMYAVHGALHLVGYRDHTPAERKRMWQRQLEIISRLGYDTKGLA